MLQQGACCYHAIQQMCSKLYPILASCHHCSRSRSTPFLFLLYSVLSATLCFLPQLLHSLPAPMQAQEYTSLHHLHSSNFPTVTYDLTSPQTQFRWEVLAL